MKSDKSDLRDVNSLPDSAGDRRTGSVGERSELAGSRDSGDRASGTSAKSRKHSIEDELARTTDSDPGLGG